MLFCRYAAVTPSTHWTLAPSGLRAGRADIPLPPDVPVVLTHALDLQLLKEQSGSQEAIVRQNLAASRGNWRVNPAEHALPDRGRESSC